MSALCICSFYPQNLFLSKLIFGLNVISIKISAGLFCQYGQADSKFTWKGKEID